jgi:hypothetical protein
MPDGVRGVPSHTYADEPPVLEGGSAAGTVGSVASGPEGKQPARRERAGREKAGREKAGRGMRTSARERSRTP